MALNYCFRMPTRGFLGIGIHAAGDWFAQEIITANFANFSRNATNDYHLCLREQN